MVSFLPFLHLLWLLQPPAISQTLRPKSASGPPPGHSFQISPGPTSSLLPSLYSHVTFSTRPIAMVWIFCLLCWEFNLQWNGVGGRAWWEVLRWGGFFPHKWINAVIAKAFCSSLLPSALPPRGEQCPSPLEDAQSKAPSWKQTWGPQCSSLNLTLLMPSSTLLNCRIVRLQ
jgi:hypothetical protein